MYCNLICGLSDVIIKTSSQSASQFVIRHHSLCQIIDYRSATYESEHSDVIAKSNVTPATTGLASNSTNK